MERNIEEEKENIYDLLSVGDPIRLCPARLQTPKHLPVIHSLSLACRQLARTDYDTNANNMYVLSQGIDLLFS